jgi:hypothetical protein
MSLSSPSVPPVLPALIACVDSNEDVVLLLRDRLVEAGYRAVTFCSPVRYGPQPVVDFLTYLAPAAAVYNVSPPYAASWAEFAHLRREVPECPSLATTTHKAALERLVGATEALEVLATAHDLDVLAEAVRALLAAQPVGARSADGLARPSGADGRGPAARERTAR